MSKTTTTQRPAATATPAAIDVATKAEGFDRYLDFLRYQREHRRITAQDASRTISFRSEETLRLRGLEARAREIPDRILDEEERVERERIEAERKAAEEERQRQAEQRAAAGE